MYVGTLPPVSNRASWIKDWQIVDDDTDELVDLTGFTITLEVRDPMTGWVPLVATIGNGLTVTDTGTFESNFSKTNMECLRSGTYEVAINVADADDEICLLIATLPVLYGIINK